MSEFDISALRLKAIAYFDEKLPNNSYTGWQRVEGSTKFEPKQNNKVEPLVSKGRDDYGNALAVIANREPSGFSWIRNQFDQTTLAQSFMGDSEIFSKLGGTVTAEALIAKKGKWVQIGGEATPKMNLTRGTLVVKNSGNTVTYVEGTDYIADYFLGLLYANTTGAITDAQELSLTFDNTAINGYTVNAETKSSYRGRLKLHGINMADDSNVMIFIPEVMIVSSSPVDFLTDKWAEFSFEGNFIKLPTEKSPYYITRYRGA